MFLFCYCVCLGHKRRKRCNTAKSRPFLLHLDFKSPQAWFNHLSGPGFIAIGTYPGFLCIFFIQREYIKTMKMRRARIWNIIGWSIVWLSGPAHRRSQNIKASIFSEVPVLMRTRNNIKWSVVWPSGPAHRIGTCMCKKARPFEIADTISADEIWAVDRPDRTTAVHLDLWACDSGFLTIVECSSPPDSVLSPSQGLSSCDGFDRWKAFNPNLEISPTCMDPFLSPCIAALIGPTA